MHFSNIYVGISSLTTDLQNQAYSQFVHALVVRRFGWMRYLLFPHMLIPLLTIIIWSWFFSPLSPQYCIAVVVSKCFVLAIRRVSYILFESVKVSYIFLLLYLLVLLCESINMAQSPGILMKAKLRSNWLLHLFEFPVFGNIRKN